MEGGQALAQREWCAARAGPCALPEARRWLRIVGLPRLPVDTPPPPKVAGLALEPRRLQPLGMEGGGGGVPGGALLEPEPETPPWEEPAAAAAVVVEEAVVSQPRGGFGIFA